MTKLDATPLLEAIGLGHGRDNRFLFTGEEFETLAALCVLGSFAPVPVTMKTEMLHVLSVTGKDVEAVLFPEGRVVALAGKECGRDAAGLLADMAACLFDRPLPDPELTGNLYEHVLDLALVRYVGPADDDIAKRIAATALFGCLCSHFDNGGETLDLDDWLSDGHPAKKDRDGVWGLPHMGEYLVPFVAFDPDSVSLVLDLDAVRRDAVLYREENTGLEEYEVKGILNGRAGGSPKEYLVDVSGDRFDVYDADGAFRLSVPSGHPLRVKDMVKTL